MRKCTCCLFPELNQHVHINIAQKGPKQRFIVLLLCRCLYIDRFDSNVWRFLHIFVSQRNCCWPSAWRHAFFINKRILVLSKQRLRNINKHYFKVCKTPVWWLIHTVCRTLFWRCWSKVTSLQRLCWIIRTRVVALSFVLNFKR